MNYQEIQGDGELDGRQCQQQQPFPARASVPCPRLMSLSFVIWLLLKNRTVLKLFKWIASFCAD